MLYLPPYSPDLKPIEKAWAKLKQLFRAAKARSKDTLDQAIAEGLQLISQTMPELGSNTVSKVYTSSGIALRVRHLYAITH